MDDKINGIFQRTEMLLGSDAIAKLKNSKVIVLGIGGVGSHCIEALARAGIENLTAVDSDIIVESNINRQIHALHSTLGRSKVEVMKERILDINPGAQVQAVRYFITAEDDLSYLSEYDYVVDAIDNVTAKLHVAKFCYDKGIRLVSSMGTGNKTDPGKFLVDDIYNTSVCPLARVIRRELKKRGVERLKVVYSKEQPRETYILNPEKRIPASISFVPPVAGYILAGVVIKDLAGI